MPSAGQDKPGGTGDGGGTAPVVLGRSVVDQMTLLIGLPILLMALGVGLPWIAQLAADLPWFPFQGPLRLVAALDQRWAMAIGLIAGLILGVGYAIGEIAGALKVTVTSTGLQLEKGDEKREVSRAEVSAVFIDGRQLVVLDHDSRELVRDELDTDRAAAAGALRRYGYPWHEADPHADLLARWVPDTPDLPSAVNAILAAREKALKDKSGDDIADLRKEVERQGFVVVDRGSRQFWRPLVRGQQGQ